jgi:hypothetical protein
VDGLFGTVHITFSAEYQRKPEQCPCSNVPFHFASFFVEKNDEQNLRWLEMACVFSSLLAKDMKNVPIIGNFSGSLAIFADHIEMC